MMNIPKNMLIERLPAEACASCGCELSSFVTGKNSSYKGIVCDDCYYDLIGDELDKNPIVGVEK